MKKQLALIIISMLAVMPAGAKSNNINQCTQNNFSKHFSQKNYNCSLELSEDCFGDIKCPVPSLPPEFSFGFSQCPDFLPEDSVIPEIPDAPQEQEKPEIEAPDTPIVPETPDNPDVPEADDGTTTNPADSVIMQLLTLVNNERVKNGIAALTYDETLELCAYVRSKEIKSLFSHTRPDGTSCFTVLDQYNYKYSYAGENIAYGQETAEEVFRDWMNSQGHRENILSPNFTRIGMSRYENGSVYWAQMFASK